MDTTTIIAFACILAIVGIALVAIGIVRACQRSEFDTSSYGLIETGVIHDYNEANRGTEIGFGISLILAAFVITLMYLAFGGVL